MFVWRKLSVPKGLGTVFHTVASFQAMRRQLIVRSGISACLSDYLKDMKLWIECCKKSFEAVGVRRKRVCSIHLKNPPPPRRFSNKLAQSAAEVGKLGSVYYEFQIAQIEQNVRFQLYMYYSNRIILYDKFLNNIPTTGILQNAVYVK